MNTERPAQTAARKPFVIRWLAWGLLILFVGGVVTTLVSTFVSVAMAGLDSRMLPFLVMIAIWVVLFFSVKATTHPFRGRKDEGHSWKEQFPTHTDVEIKRFLQVVGDELGIRKEHWCRLCPDDRVSALSQEWLCGDGMDVVELLMSIETEYGLDLPERFHERDRDLGDLFDYVSQHASRQSVSFTNARRDQPEQG